jgi:hypothetical protein
MGMTAGRGMEGAGETERLDEKEDRRLWLMTLGGFMGNEVGVPGADGTGEPMFPVDSTESCERKPKSGGAGLLEDILRGGRSALEWLAILGVLSSSWLLREYCPSLVFNVYM